MTNEDSHPFKAPDCPSANSIPDHTSVTIAPATSTSPNESPQDTTESPPHPLELPEPQNPDETSVTVTEQSTQSPSTNSDTNGSCLPPGIPYTVPEWSGLCQAPEYSLEVLKNGVVISTIDLTVRPTHVFGRLPACHQVLEHPSLSRFHAVLQYRAVPGPNRGQGWYLFDLDSTHGTIVNKIKVRPMEFHRLRVGHVVKFGGSSRLYVVQGPEEDRETESETTYSEQLALREKRRAELEEKRLAAEKAKLERPSGSCSWGFADDAVEDETEEVFEMADEPKHEEQYIKDPKKFLRSYFEREGYDQPEYEFLDAGFGKHHCRVELIPLQGSSAGKTTFAEAIISGGKKKEAVAACALEACRMLDRMGELFKTATSRAQRRMRDWAANEFYDSDEDTFLDRTGDIERKRARRMAQAGKCVEEEKNGKASAAPKVDTFESLTKQFAELGEEIRNIEETLERSRKQLQGGENPATSELDALDAYMEGIKAGALDRRSRMALKITLTEKRRKSDVLRKRLQAAAPNLSVLAMRAGGINRTATSNEVPAVTTPKEPKTESEANIQKDDERDCSKSVTKSSQPSTGRMRFSIRSAGRKPLPTSALSVPVDRGGDSAASVIEEEEEEEDEEEEEEVQEKVMRKEEGAISVESPPKIEAIAVSGRIPTDPELPVKVVEDIEVPAPSPIMFPAKPPPEAMETDVSLLNDKPKRRKRPRPPQPAPKHKPNDEYPDDPDYVCWMPPENQTGDGVTALNARFGY